MASAAARTSSNGSFLSKIGNADIVRCMAECRGVLTLLAKEDSFSGLYVELSRRSGDIIDSYFWIDKAEPTAQRNARRNQVRRRSGAGRI
jgi:hypothetical protein